MLNHLSHKKTFDKAETDSQNSNLEIDLASDDIEGIVDMDWEEKLRGYWEAFLNGEERIIGWHK